MTDAKDSKGPVFIVGSERSGTTVIAEALLYGAGLKGYLEGHFLPLLHTLKIGVADYYHKRKGLVDDQNLMISAIDQNQVEKKLVEMFRDLADPLFEEDFWFDKTPGGPMILATPYLLAAWPDACFIFAKRRGIECMVSRLKKFPAVSFENHCIFWQHSMQSWLEVRDQLKGHYIEIDQREIAINPERTARSIGGLLSLDTQKIRKIEDILKNRRPQSTGGKEHSKAMSMGKTGWTTDQMEIFFRHCGSIMEKYGYSDTASYYLESSLRSDTVKNN